MILALDVEALEPRDTALRMGDETVQARGDEEHDFVHAPDATHERSKVDTSSKE